MKLPGPWLIIPMETKVRELHGKLLLASFAAEAGYSVLIGEQIELRQKLADLPRGIILEKGATTHQVADLRRSHELGNRVVAWCEEGLVYRNRDAYLRDRISLECMSIIDAFFTWGDVQTADVRDKVGDTADRLFVTGNPRFDLLRPELRDIFRPSAETIRATLGNFILIATNFGRVNHFRGADFVDLLLRERGALATPDLKTFAENWTMFSREVFEAFLHLVPQLARAFPEKTIVIRPHPSERRQTWERAFDDYPNVQIIHEGNVASWILAADLLIHNSCTTGVEASLLGKPVIAYRPATSDTYDSKLPNAVSFQGTTVSEVIELIKAITMGQEIPGDTVEARRQRQATLRQYVHGTQGAFAAERIIEAIGGLSVPPSQADFGLRHHASMLKVESVSILRETAARAIGRIVVGGAYRRHKFPGLNRHEMESILENFRVVIGRFGSVKVESVPGLRNIFLVSGGGHLDRNREL